MATVGELMVKVQELLTKVSALLGRRDNSLTEFQAWFGGAADGGAAGDGLFPLTDSSGFIRMVPSPARQMLDVAQRGLQFGSLPVAEQDDVIPDKVQLVGRGKADGQPVLIAPSMFASRRTRDMEEIQKLHGHDVFMSLAAAAPSTQEYKIAARHIMREFSGGFINVKHPPYNCAGDVQEVRDGKCYPSSNYIEINDPLFREEDVGKFISVSNARLHPQYGSVAKHFTITKYLHSKAVEVSGTADHYHGTNSIIWGTDDTIGFQQALDDAGSPYAWVYGGCLQIPPGRYLCRSLVYRNGSATVGAGPRQATITHRHLTGAVGQQQPLLRNDTNIGNCFVGFLQLDGAKYHQYDGVEATFRWYIDPVGGKSPQGIDPYPFFSHMVLQDAAGRALWTTGRHSGDHVAVQIYNAQAEGWVNSSYDVNAFNFLAIGCGYAGYMSGERYFYAPSANCNIMNAKISYNGNAGWDTISQANMVEFGESNNYSNFRLQESMGSGLVLGQVVDPNGGGGGANWNKFDGFAVADTGCIGFAHGGGPRPGVDFRAMIAFLGNRVVGNQMDVVYGGGEVHGTDNFASHGIFVDGDTGLNRCNLITRPGTQWHQPSATADNPAGAWMVRSSGGIGTNRMTVDDVAVA